jgi:hypothetical protein
MADEHQPLVPIWAEARAKRQVDVLTEVARVAKDIDETDRIRAAQPIGCMTERDLEAEQFRLEQLLQSGAITVDGYRRLREIDFCIDGMRRRRHHGPTHEAWNSEYLSDD